MKTFLAGVLVVGGFAVITFGVSLLYEPAGWLLAGASLFALGLAVTYKPNI